MVLLLRSITRYLYNNYNLTPKLNSEGITDKLTIYKRKVFTKDNVKIDIYEFNNLTKKRLKIEISKGRCKRTYWTENYNSAIKFINEVGGFKNGETKEENTSRDDT